MPAGRPPKYDPSYCERVVEMGKEGYSVVEMAAELGVHRQTLEMGWPEEYPEFSTAFTQARQCSQAWWERQGRLHMLMAPGMGTFNASVWSRSMAARFPHDWREKTEVKSEVTLTETVSKEQRDAAVQAALRADS